MTMTITKEQALQIARESGATPYTNRHFPKRPFNTFSPEQLEAFAQRAYALGRQERDYELMGVKSHTEIKYSRLWLKIGVQSFAIDYTPEDEPDFSASDAMVWMQKQLDIAIAKLISSARLQGAEEAQKQWLEHDAYDTEGCITDLERVNQGLLGALKRLESAIDWHLGRSAFTQTTQLKGLQHSSSVRKELFEAHDAARATIAAYEQGVGK